MTLSVIIPVYNTQQYVQRCVDSVVHQSFVDMEIILVDDGSTDGSGAVCDKIATSDTRIKVLHKQNGGLSDARNYGLLHATGDYVAFLDSDDYWLVEDGIAKMMAQLSVQPTDLLLFKRSDIYPQKQTTERDYEVGYMQTHTAQEVFEHLVLTERFNMSACFQLIRRELLFQHNLLFPVGLLSEDVDWSLRLWQCVQTVQAMNITMYGYCHREGSITTTYSVKSLLSYDEMFTNWKINMQHEDCSNAQAIGTYLSNLYVSCVYKYLYIETEKRIEAYHILVKHADLLQYARTKKSLRLKKVRAILGLRLTIYVFAIYGKMK